MKFPLYCRLNRVRATRPVDGGVLIRSEVEYRHLHCYSHPVRIDARAGFPGCNFFTEGLANPQTARLFAYGLTSNDSLSVPAIG